MISEEMISAEATIDKVRELRMVQILNRVIHGYL